MTELKRFSHKVAVVTGAAQGIGRAIALRFAQEGGRIALLDLKDTGDAVAECQKTGADTIGLPVNVSKKENIARAIDQILERWGQIDIWVNNAGVFDDTPLTELSEERWDQVVNVNHKGMFFCAQLVAPHMLARSQGRLINIASMAAKVAFPDEVAYCSSKSAVLGLTRALAVELGPHGITVNAICPGPIETEMLRNTHQSLADRHNTTLEAWQTQILQTIPVGRYGQPADVAGLAAFLASDDAAFINAQAINIDGGMVFY